MASFAYDSFMNQLVRGAVNFAAGSFKVQLTTSAYTPNQATDGHRSDVTNEVTGTGYTAGGQAIVPTIALDTTNHKVTITFPPVTWPSSSITARRAQYYLSLGSAAADILICQDEFQTPVAAQTISSITASGQVATLTTAAAHGLNTGDTITVSNASPAAYNGTFAFTKLSATTGTYSLLSAPGAPAASVGAYTAGTPADVSTTLGTFTLAATSFTLNTPV